MSRAEPMDPAMRKAHYGHPSTWTDRQTRRYWHKLRRMTGMTGRKGHATPRQRKPRRDA